jgi:zinc protease
MNNIPDFSTIKVDDFNPTIKLLDNGIKVYYFNNNDMDVVFTKFIFYNAGTINQEKFFVALTTKALLNQGTKSYSSLDIANSLDFFGVDFSGATTNEQTTLSFSFLSEYQKDVFPYMKEIIKCPTFPQKELDITINKTKQDFLLRCQQTDFLAKREFLATLFGKGTPYGMYGLVEDYDKVQREDLIKFYNQRYSYNQCYIIAAGKVNNDFLNLLNDNFGKDSWNEKTAITKNIEIELTDKPVSKTTYTNLDNAVQASIVMGKMFPKRDSEDYIPLKVLTCILGGYFNSRLMSNIREEKGYTYGIDAIHIPVKDSSVFMIITDVKADKDKETIENIYYEMDKLCKEEVREEELNTVKHYLIGETLRNMDGVMDISDYYANIIKYSLPDNYNSYFIDTMNKVDSKKIKELANRYFKKDSFTISIAKDTKE